MTEEPQVHLIWPVERLSSPPPVYVPEGYILRLYRPGDEPFFFEVMEQAGWPGWNEKRLRPWQERLLQDGWFMVVHLESERLVATAMALQDCEEFGEPGGEIGWVACVPSHRRRGLGTAVTVAALRRLLAEGFRYVHLYTEPWRTGALAMYRRLGFVSVQGDCFQGGNRVI